VRLVVEPDALLQAAAALRAASQTAGGMRASLVVHGTPQTGRADSTAAVERVLAILDRTLLQLAMTLDEESRDLAVAAHAYADTDGRCLVPGSAGAR